MGRWRCRGDGRGCVETAPVRVEVRDAGGSVVVGSGGGGGRVEVAAAWWGRGGSRSRVSEVEGCRRNVEVPGQGRGAAHADAGVVVLRLRRSRYAHRSGRSCPVKMSMKKKVKKTHLSGAKCCKTATTEWPAYTCMNDRLRVGAQVRRVGRSHAVRCEAGRRPLRRR
ncbi:hypothetical protein EDB84DRAFT_263663 [Lactarius hengduanensis]|nr:hypothetical protein EDB84DRAFT_263663 [Lactarius hengduanensis]